MNCLFIINFIRLSITVDKMRASILKIHKFLLFFSSAEITEVNVSFRITISRETIHDLTT